MPPAAAALLALQATVGNRGVTALLQRHPVVQRRVGFEFEADSVHAARLTRPLTPMESNLAPAVRQIPILDVEPFRKKDVLALGHGFTLEADEDMNNRDALGRVRSDIEFVTEPFEETSAGRKRLAAAGKDMIRVHDLIAALSPNNLPRQYNWPEETSALHLRPDALLETPGGGFTVKMQSTAGIRLDQIPEIMSQLGEAPAGTHETKGQAKDRALGRRSVLPNMRFAAIARKMGEAPGRADAAIRTFSANHAPGTAGHDAAVVNMGDTTALRGLLTLLGLQLRIYDELAMGPYLKAMSPIMPRTNFAGMFALLPKNQRRLFRRHHCARWLEVVGLACPGLNLQAAVISQPNNTWNVQLQRDDWLRDITGGHDRLTEEWQAAQVEAAHPNRPMAFAEETQYDQERANTGYLEGQGSYGRRTERVGAGVLAPMLEFRTVMQDAANSTLAFGDALELAVQMHVWITRLNEGKRKAVGQ